MPLLPHEEEIYFVATDLHFFISIRFKNPMYAQNCVVTRFVVTV